MAVDKANDSTAKKTINILYIPGGAMLGILPAVLLTRLENLTETPAHELFQVAEGTSTGSLIVAGINRRRSAVDMVNLFCKHGPRFFPYIPNRNEKMMVAHGFNVIHDMMDPLQSDDMIIKEIKQQCQAIKGLVPPDQWQKIKRMQDLSTQRWLTRSDKNRAKSLCQDLQSANSDHPNILEILNNLYESITVRMYRGRLSNAFKASVMTGMNLVKKVWAHDFLFDPNVPKETYQALYGPEMRMGDCSISTYIATYDAEAGTAKTFYCRKKDFFNSEPDTDSLTSPENIALWDAVMASTANTFAFPPHITEDGTLCEDKAVVHSPIVCINDVLDNKPKDTNVRLIILGTGSFLPESVDKDELSEHIRRYGPVGKQVISKRGFDELEAYAMSMALESIKNRIGEENIIQIIPRLVPRNPREERDFPSRDTLNASKENVKKILNRAHGVIQEEDEQIRKVACLLIDNLHVLGKIDDEKHQRIMRKISAPDDDLTVAADAEIGRQRQAPPLLVRIFEGAARNLGTIFTDKPPEKAPPASKRKKPDDHPPPP